VRIRQISSKHPHRSRWWCSRQQRKAKGCSQALPIKNTSTMGKKRRKNASHRRSTRVSFENGRDLYIASISFECLTHSWRYNYSARITTCECIRYLLKIRKSYFLPLQPLPQLVRSFVPQPAQPPEFNRHDSSISSASKIKLYLLRTTIECLSNAEVIDHS
jgi:hypothetical protein